MASFTRRRKGQSDPNTNVIKNKIKIIEIYIEIEINIETHT